MKTREETYIIEHKKTIYIASDGKEFNCKEICRNYEKSLVVKNLMKTANDFRIVEMEDWLPICYSPYSEYDSTFQWYRVRSNEDVDLLAKIYDETFPYPESYPELICVENYCSGDEIFSYTGTDMIRSVKSFFESAGYECVITEKGDGE